MRITLYFPLWFLDLACGIGRWADALEIDVAEYCGVDFSQSLINLAKERNQKPVPDYHLDTSSHYKGTHYCTYLPFSQKNARMHVKKILSYVLGSRLLCRND